MAVLGCSSMTHASGADPATVDLVAVHVFGLDFVACQFITLR